MNVAFITVVNLDDLSDLPGVAQEISDDLTQAGFEVTSVHAWARPGGFGPAPTPSISPTLSQPNTTIQTNPNTIT